MSQATPRTQYLDYNLIRSGQFTPMELSLIHHIATYSNDCRPPTLEVLGKCLQRSGKTISRTIKRLVQKGIIIKRYTFFKKLILKVIPLKDQAKLRGSGMLKAAIKRVCKPLKSLKKRPDRTSVSELKRTLVSESIKNETLKEINILKDKNILNPGPKESLSDKKNRMLREFLAYKGMQMS